MQKNPNKLLSGLASYPEANANAALSPDRMDGGETIPC